MCFLFSLNLYIIKIKIWQSCGIIKFNLANIYGDPFVGSSLPGSLQELPFGCRQWVWETMIQMWLRRKLKFTVEGGWLGRHHVRSNFLLDVGESTRFDLQRGKSFQVRGTKIGFSWAREGTCWQRSPSGFSLQDVPENGEAGPQEAL